MKRIRPLELAALTGGALDPRLPAERGRRAQAGHDLSGSILGLRPADRLRRFGQRDRGLARARRRRSGDSCSFPPEGRLVPASRCASRCRQRPPSRPRWRWTSSATRSRSGSSPSTGRDSVVEAAIRPAGGEWSPPEALSAPGEPAFGADVEIAEGQATAVWVANENRVPVVRSASRTMTWSVV